LLPPLFGLLVGEASLQAADETTLDEPCVHRGLVIDESLKRGKALGGVAKLQADAVGFEISAVGAGEITVDAVSGGHHDLAFDRICSEQQEQNARHDGGRPARTPRLAQRWSGWQLRP
jgi:hypothetical protein